MSKKIVKIISIVLVFITIFTIAPFEANAAKINSTSITSIYNSYQGIKLKWKKVNNADGYYISRKTGKNGKWKKLATTKNLSFIDKSTQANKTYYYKVRTYKGTKNRKYSSFSKIKSQKYIPSPKMISANEKEGYVEVKYNAVKGAKEYYIYRKSGKNGTYKRIATTRNSAKYKDWECKSNKTYYYSVKANVNGVISGRYPGKKCVITYYAGDCEHTNIDHKKVIKPTNVLPGYTINYCKCEKTAQISNIKNPIGQVQADPNKPAYSEAVKRNNASVKYLNEILKKDKVDLLQVYFGSNDDIRALKKYSDNIVAGCNSTEDKARTLYNWVINNIEYDMETGQHACDVMRYKKGDCTGMSEFLSDCLKLQGIPAVTLTGYVGDTKNVFTINNMSEVSGGVGHEWVRAYVNNEWVFIDCTFQRYITSNDDFDIPAWYYTVTTDRAIPYYNGMNFKYSSQYPVYINGKYYVIDDNGKQELDVGGTGVFILPDININFAFHSFGTNINNPKQLMTRSISWDGKEYLPGQAYTSTRVSNTGKALNYDDYVTQTYYNGRTVVDTTFSFDGINYLNDGLMAYKNYSGKHLAMKCSSIVLQPNEKITFVVLLKKAKSCKVRWTSSNPKVATVDNYGNVTAKSKGYTEINCKDVTNKNSACFDVSYTLCVEGEEYILKDSDLAPQSAIKTQRSKIKKPGNR